MPIRGERKYFLLVNCYTDEDSKLYFLQVGCLGFHDAFIATSWAHGDWLAGFWIKRPIFKMLIATCDEKV